jgi:hypothetical protein
MLCHVNHTQAFADKLNRMSIAVKLSWYTSVFGVHREMETSVEDRASVVGSAFDHRSLLPSRRRLAEMASMR